MATTITTNPGPLLGARNEQENSKTQDGLGLFYHPDSPTEDCFSTVIISGIEPGTEVRDVLSRVRGGVIVKIALMNTTTITEDSYSAMVTFLRGAAAKAYVNHVQEHGVTLHGRLLKAAVVALPTYPPKLVVNMASCQVLRDIPDTYSRCLEIRNFPRDRISPPQLKAFITMHSRANPIALINHYDNGTLEIHFTSIQGAQFALEQFQSKGRFVGCKVSFAKDPCAGPIEQLKD